jgi:hypothetical protein
VSAEPIDPVLCELVLAVVVEAHERIRALDPDRMPHISDWKQAGAYDSGMPFFSTAPTAEAPPAYGMTIGPGSGPFTQISYGDLTSMRRLLDYGRATEPLVDRFRPPPYVTDDLAASMVDHQIANLATDVLERLLHLGEPLTRDHVCALYRQLEANVLGTEHPVETLAPILCTFVDAEQRYELAEDIWVERLDDRTQLARARLRHLGPIQDVLLNAATHAVVATGGSSGYVGLWAPWPDYSTLPWTRIDQAFAALRIASDNPIGYAQLVLRPVGWASHWTADLPPLEAGPVERRYTSRLDNYGWLRPPMPLTSEALSTGRFLLDALDKATPRVRLAARRLASALLREDEEDVIVDTCVGVEALLDDGKGQEMTHKLSLRAAAVLARGGANPIEVAAWVKKVYGMRSDVVHGRPDVRRSRTIAIEGVGPVPTVRVARSLLRSLLMALLRRPELQSTDFIDSELVLQSLRIDDASGTNDASA